ncbi:hypothetical protein GVN16_16200 [Emticicia sp. CRIBPO]|uniref:hypothetical protein n=1 Tax=Emticicia sp. CRIBPO TaxID=2683258 RepID=UPI001412757B|nr:hypothetical protein [Emticicia sp. CRIBPO]NBA87317.1 hypothetical protein [Emticicia sp. CRIBPO]
MRFLLFILLYPAMSLTYGQMSSSVSAGVTLPSVALLDIEPSGSVSLNFTSPSEAGNILGSSSTNNSKWINITSAVASGVTRKITARISGTAPAGVRLRVSAASVAGSGAGTRGTPGSALFLTTSDQILINGIGGGYTGTGNTNGFNLTYSLDIQTYNLLKSGAYTFSVVYTLADN